MKTHCKRGHPRTPENLSSIGSCLACQREKGAERYRAKREVLGKTVMTQEEYHAFQKANHKACCINGHPYTPETARKNRGCKVCNREQERARRAMKPKTPKPPRTHCRNGHPEDRNAQGLCRECCRESDRRSAAKQVEASKARKLDRDKVWIDSSTGKPVSKTRRVSLRNMGWTQQMVETTSAEQGNRCAICRKPSDHKGHQMHAGGLVADHKHSKPPEPRAMLCSNCNSLIGFAKDNPEICRAAAEYLESWA